MECGHCYEKRIVVEKEPANIDCSICVARESTVTRLRSSPSTSYPAGYLSRYIRLSHPIALDASRKRAAHILKSIRIYASKLKLTVISRSLLLLVLVVATLTLKVF